MTGFELMINIISICSGITGMILGIVNYYRSKANIVKEYFLADDSTELRKARSEIKNYKYHSEKELINDLSFAKVCNHYHFYGLMLKKHFIPKWVFTGVNKEAINFCYQKSEQYIQLRRKERPSYAQYFEWLYLKLNKKRWFL